MSVSVQVVFEHIAHVDYIDERVRQEAEKLEQFGERLMSVRAVIGRPQHRHHKGDTYSVRLHLTVPGSADIAVSRDPAETGRHEDVNVTMTHAFGRGAPPTAGCRAQEEGHVKAHESPPHGTVRLLVPERDHGFITSADGERHLFSSQQCGRRPIRQSQGWARGAICGGRRRQGATGDNRSPGWQTPPRVNRSSSDAHPG